MRLLGGGIDGRVNEAVEEVKAGVGTLREVVEVDGERRSCERTEDDDGACGVIGGRLCERAAGGYEGMIGTEYG